MVEVSIFFVIAAVLIVFFSRKDGGQQPSITRIENCKWTKWQKIDNGDSVFWRRQCKKSGIIQKTFSDPKGK